MDIPPQTSSPGQRKEPATTVSDPKGYWKANLRLIVTLLSVWAVVSYGCSILFVEPLNHLRIGNLPLGFWFGQQGAIFIFVGLILIYAVRMDRLDKKHGVDE
jgi:putative solute:sodium symporter small subunit